MTPRLLTSTVPTPGLREFAAALLQAASRALGRIARALLRRRPVAAGDPVYEFYAQAGAPEGALYVDGQLVGTLDGVTRL